MNILKRTKKFKQTASDFLNEKNDHPIKMIFKDNFNKSLFSRLKKGEIIISRELIRYQLVKAVESEEDVELDYIACTKKGVTIGIIINKFNIHFTAQIVLFIDKFVLDSNEQQVIIDISNEKVHGHNFAGKLVSALVGTLISNLLKKSITSLDLPVIFNKHRDKALIDLENIPAIYKMRTKPVLGTSRTMLNFISIVEAKHTESEIILKCKVNLFK